MHSSLFPVACGTARPTTPCTRTISSAPRHATPHTHTMPLPSYMQSLWELCSQTRFLRPACAAHLLRRALHLGRQVAHEAAARGPPRALRVAPPRLLPVVPGARRERPPGSDQQQTLPALLLPGIKPLRAPRSGLLHAHHAQTPQRPAQLRLETTFAVSHAHRIRAVRASVYWHPTTLLACGMPVGVGLVRHRHGVEPRRPVHAVAGAQALSGRAGARVGSRRHGAVARHQRLRPRPEAERVGRRAAVGVHRRAVAARLRSPALHEASLVM